MSGKGDRPRPVDQKKFADNYDRIFGSEKSANEPFEEQYFWVSPPSGYIWGFPKIIKLPVSNGQVGVFDLDKILRDAGYPKDRIDKGESSDTYIWPVDIEDVEFNVINALTNPHKTR